MAGYEANTRETALEKVLGSSERVGICLECPLTPSSIYPMVKIGGKFVRAGRLVYEMHHGVTIPDGKYACHTCDNPKCVEWSHIYIGTPKQNSLDRENRGRSNPQWGKHHWTARSPDLVAKGTEHHNARMTPEDVYEIRRLYAEGLKQDEIAAKFQCSRGHISLIVTRKKWAHLP